MNSTKEGVPGSVYGVLAVVVVGLWLAGIFQILAGVIAGTLIVGALMMTIEQMLNPRHIRRAEASDHAVDFVALLEQQLGEIRPILTGDPGD